MSIVLTPFARTRLFPRDGRRNGSQDGTAEAFEQRFNHIEAVWGVVGCLYTTAPEEIPMAPITMLRKAPGVVAGSSGVPLDHAAYRQGVAFRDAHANGRGLPQPRSAQGTVSLSCWAIGNTTISWISMCAGCAMA